MFCAHIRTGNSQRCNTYPQHFPIHLCIYSSPLQGNATGIEPWIVPGKQGMPHV